MTECNPKEFIRAITRLWWDHDGMDIDGCDFQEIATKHGIIIWRKPTQEELDDDNWFGHEFDMAQDDNGVGELHPDLKPKE